MKKDLRSLRTYVLSRLESSRSTRKHICPANGGLTSGSGAAASNITTIRSATPFIAPSATPFTEPSGSPSDLSSSSHCPTLSPSALDLYVDLSSYSLYNSPLRQSGLLRQRFLASTIWCCVSASTSLPT